jgi:hypothetical protein
LTDFPLLPADLKIDPNELLRINFFLCMHPTRKLLVEQIAHLLPFMLLGSGKTPVDITKVLNLEDAEQRGDLDYYRRLADFKMVLGLALVALETEAQLHRSKRTFSNRQSQSGKSWRAEDSTTTILAADGMLTIQKTANVRESGGSWDAAWSLVGGV